MMNKSVVLLSGGIDSAVALALESMKLQASECFTLSASYGQSHWLELHSAKFLSFFYKATRHVEVSVPLGDFAKSPITQHYGIAQRTLEELRQPFVISPEYVPGRNSLLLALGASFAESIGATRLVIGANADDHQFPDCRREYFDAFQEVVKIGTATGPEVVAPLILHSKTQVIQLAIDLGVPLKWTTSCYRPHESKVKMKEDATQAVACGVCDACVVRIDAFKAVGHPDPIVYRDDK
ncbi:MAG TPA: 7-cyano-7-deazaguanine synthase [Candidatus Heimdallarchaeota archaeon]|nr:7-cyano-7-deazaguanine synthase [Candidatus Heimdallarchaeota archaeon]